MHGIAAITGNMHRSLRYFVLLERITSNNNNNNLASETVLGVDNAKLIMFDVYYMDCYVCPLNTRVDSFFFS